MTQAEKQPKRNTATDSFLGMTLATAFCGFAYGDVAVDTMRAGEAISAVYEDRHTDGNFELGVNGKLTDKFTGFSFGFNEPAKAFGLLAAAPAPAPRAFAI